MLSGLLPRWKLDCWRALGADEHEQKETSIKSVSCPNQHA